MQRLPYSSDRLVGSDLLVFHTILLSLWTTVPERSYPLCLQRDLTLL